jgi:hypothetical protein
LGSGCARHLTGTPNLLTSNISEAQTPLNKPDGSTVKSTKRGTVTMKSEILGQTMILDIANVELVPGLKKNLLLYVRLEQKVIRLVDEGKKRYLANASAKMAEVFEAGNLLVVRFRAMDKQANADMICSVLAEQEHTDVHEDSLYQFHELASKPECGIKLIDHEMPHCIVCAEGKQTRNKQSQQDFGNNAPINRIGVAICSDLKGPITPAGRNDNRYMIKFIDYKTNCCRVFLAKTKDQAAKKFEHFLSWFERRFGCRIQVLRTDGGLEYKNAYTKAHIESDSDIYMYPSNGMTLTKEEQSAGGTTPVLKLQRSLYGMKQAVRLWNNMLHA